MCTAISLNSKLHLFGRTLDLECSFNEKIIITPRNYAINLRNYKTIKNHYAIIGIGISDNGYPLYYDAANEVGLCIAGLNFPSNAKYNEINNKLTNIASFEFIPYILATCKNVDEAIEKMRGLNITNLAFSNDLQPSPLHWLISDKDSSITIEPICGGLKIYDNYLGVLTNNPSFDFHLLTLSNYNNLSAYEKESCFTNKINTNRYSRGLSAYGLPGDLSSNSRFIRACFTKLNSISPNDENGDITQFFHILETVSQTLGNVRLENGELEKTVYTSCCDSKNSIYYFTTYCNRRINAVQLKKENIDSNNLIEYQIQNEQEIKYLN